MWKQLWKIWGGRGENCILRWVSGGKFFLQALKIVHSWLSQSYSLVVPESQKCQPRIAPKEECEGSQAELQKDGSMEAAACKQNNAIPPILKKSAFSTSLLTGSIGAVWAATSNIVDKL